MILGAQFAVFHKGALFTSLYFHGEFHRIQFEVMKYMYFSTDTPEYHINQNAYPYSTCTVCYVK